MPLPSELSLFSDSELSLSSDDKSKSLSSKSSDSRASETTAAIVERRSRRRCFPRALGPVDSYRRGCWSREGALAVFDQGPLFVGAGLVKKRVRYFSASDGSDPLEVLDTSGIPGIRVLFGLIPREPISSLADTIPSVGRRRMPSTFPSIKRLPRGVWDIRLCTGYLELAGKPIPS